MLDERFDWLEAYPSLRNVRLLLPNTQQAGAAAVPFCLLRRQRHKLISSLGGANFHVQRSRSMQFTHTLSGLLVLDDPPHKLSGGCNH